ncbi:hypothetical protein, partial [Plasmodium yoelii yoelii]
NYNINFIIYLYFFNLLFIIYSQFIYTSKYKV